MIALMLFLLALAVVLCGAQIEHGCAAIAKAILKTRSVRKGCD